MISERLLEQDFVSDRFYEETQLDIISSSFVLESVNLANSYSAVLDKISGSCVKYIDNVYNELISVLSTTYQNVKEKANNTLKLCEKMNVRVKYPFFESYSEIEDIRVNYLGSYISQIVVNMDKIINNKYNKDEILELCKKDNLSILKKQVSKLKSSINPDAIISEKPAVVEFNIEDTPTKFNNFFNYVDSNADKIKVTHDSLVKALEGMYSELAKIFSVLDRLTDAGELDNKQLKLTNAYLYHSMKTISSIMTFCAHLFIKKVNGICLNISSITNFVTDIENMTVKVITEESEIKVDFTLDKEDIYAAMESRNPSSILMYIQPYINYCESIMDNPQISSSPEMMAMTDAIGVDKSAYTMSFDMYDEIVKIVEGFVSDILEDNPDDIFDDLVHTNGLTIPFTEKYKNIIATLDDLGYYMSNLTANKDSGLTENQVAIAEAMIYFKELKEVPLMMTQLADKMCNASNKIEDSTKAIEMLANKDDSKPSAIIKEALDFMKKIKKNFDELVVENINGLISRIEAIKNEIDGDPLINDVDIELLTYDYFKSQEGYDFDSEESKIVTEAVIAGMMMEHTINTHNNLYGYYTEASATENKVTNTIADAKEKKGIIGRIIEWVKNLINKFTNKLRELLTNNDQWLKENIQRLRQLDTTNVNITILPFNGFNPSKIVGEVNKVNANIRRIKVNNNQTKEQLESSIFGSIPKKLGNGQLTFSQRVLHYYSFGTRSEERISLKGQDVEVLINNMLNFVEQYEQISADVTKALEAGAQNVDGLNRQSINRNAGIKPQQQEDNKDSVTVVGSEAQASQSIQAVVTLYQQYSTATLTALERRYNSYVKILRQIGTKVK